MTRIMMLSEFRELIASAKVDESQKADSPVYVFEGGNYIERPYFWDFNLEVNHKHKRCAVRCDDDFWICARLPYECQWLSIEEIVPVIWPFTIGEPDLKYLPNCIYDKRGKKQGYWAEIDRAHYRSMPWYMKQPFCWFYWQYKRFGMWGGPKWLHKIGCALRLHQYRYTIFQSVGICKHCKGVKK